MTDKNEVLEIVKKIWGDHLGCGDGTAAVVGYMNNYADADLTPFMYVFAAALEEKHQAQIAMLRDTLEAARNGVMWYIENSDDANSSDEEMLKQIEDALDRTQQSSDAFLAEVRAKAIRQFIKDFSFENAINSYRCSYCLDADSDAPLPLLDAIGGLGMPIGNAITEIELLADWIGGEMLYAAELRNSAAQTEFNRMTEKGAEAWKDVTDSSEWLENLRGGTSAEQAEGKETK